ncbi:MAG: hypothetical protein II781_05350 [Clostridia bacterium]|nr:hypothetical protein [Clostridia bacterium]
MKYGESTFDILYLLFALTAGCVLLNRAKNKPERLMGIAALVLGCGDAFHLIPRVLNYFVNGDFSAALGIGKLVTSVTMTIFYLLLYFIWQGVFRSKENRTLTALVWVFTVVRVLLCLFPQNGWLTNESGLTWSIVRNIPFLALGALICILYFQKRKENAQLRRVWLYILFSFTFYIPVAVGAGFVPMLGMLMLPKTICYILLLAAFLRYVCRRDNLV